VVIAVDVARALVELVAIAIVSTGEVLDPVLAMVDRDPVEPRRELRLLAERVDRLEHGDEHLLRDILGLVTVAEHAVGDVEHPVPVFVDELAERSLVAVAQAPQQRSFKLGHGPAA
jgi:hypothetical protein